MSILQMDDTIKRGQYEFSVECDIPDWIVWVYKDGKPLKVKGTDRQIRKWLGDSNRLNERYLYNFIDKFVSDEEYRNEYISGERKR